MTAPVSAAAAQALIDAYEAQRAADWLVRGEIIMTLFYDKIIMKSKLGKDRTTFRYDDLSPEQNKFLDYIKDELTDQNYELGDVNECLTVKW